MKRGDGKDTEEHPADSISLNNTVILNHSGWSSVLIEASHLPSSRRLAALEAFAELHRLQPHEFDVCENLYCSTSGSNDLSYTLILAIQAAKHPEVRSLILSVAKTATGEGVRSSIFATRDLLLGETRQMAYTVFPSQQGLQSRVLEDTALQQPLSNRTLGTLLIFIFMPIIIFLAGRRAALA